MQYEYDTNGDLSSLVLMTFLLVVLVPLSYRVVFPKKSRTAAVKSFPITVDDDENAKKVVHKRPQQSSLGNLYKNYFTTKNVFLIGGWATVAYLSYRVATTKRETKYWNPYDILGIAESATDKEIKKHYKRLTIKFHPDKVKLAINQTLEQVQEQFVDITKAYKALTDDEVRQNFLEHGNPDGKQDMSVGIALPSWMVEGGQSLWVLAAYCLTLLVGLPTLVGRWWYRSAKVTKDGLLNLTAERYFKGIQDKMTLDQIIALLCSAAEFDILPKSDSDVRDLEKRVNDVSGVKADATSKSTAEVLLRAHMLRVSLDSVKLLALQSFVLEQAELLHKGLFSVALSYGYLKTQMQIFELSPAIIQAVMPGQSPLLQLPYVTKEDLAKSELDVANLSMQDFFAMEEPGRRALLPVSDSKYERIMSVALALPVVEAARVAYQVEGDDRITSNAIVQLVFKLRLAGGEPLKESDLADVQTDEDNVEAILNADATLAKSAVPDTLSWAPYFPVPPKPHLWLSMADSKQDRVIVGPLQVEDIGDKLRTFKIPFQAPPTEGLYTFQVYIKSDTYCGMDETFHMELNVVGAASSGVKEEDEISEPDEDTIAGQMAAMKGGTVKKHEYESSSEEELTDSSDDDSDSD